MRPVGFWTRTGAAGFRRHLHISRRDRKQLHISGYVRRSRAYQPLASNPDAVLDVALVDLGLGEVVSFTAETNVRSEAVMRRLGMTRDPADDFDHPALAPGHRLRRHVLYRVTAGGWRAGGR